MDRSTTTRDSIVVIVPSSRPQLASANVSITCMACRRRVGVDFRMPNTTSEIVRCSEKAGNFPGVFVLGSNFV